MTIEYPIAVSILASYFVLIAGLTWRVAPDIKHSIKNHSLGVIIFLCLAVISFIATWTYMFKFFLHSYMEWRALANYKYDNVSFSLLNSISYWLHDVSLFDSAWRQVCVGAWQWLWSHQLCSLTVAVWTPILAIEGSRRRIPYVWAYMILGQVVAISVASSLFFAVMLVYPSGFHQNVSKKLLWTLGASTVGGIITVIISPYVASTGGFMPNLLVMHILLIFPLASKKFIYMPQFGSISTPLIIITLYTFAAGANLSIYINQWLTCLATLEVKSGSFICDVYTALIGTFFGHPAQTSISYDIVCMQIISVAWMLISSKIRDKKIPSWVLGLVLLTPILSASVTLPLFFAGCEYKNVLKND